jgi:hypothetical protein
LIVADDYIDGDSLSSGFGDLGSALFGAGPTFNLGNQTANTAASQTYLTGLLSGESSDTAGLDAASYGNGISGAMGTLPGETSNGSSPTTSGSSSSFTQRAGCLLNASGPSEFWNCVAGTGSNGGGNDSISSYFGRGITAVLGIIFVIGALYLFGSSSLTDAISSVAQKAATVAE